MTSPKRIIVIGASAGGNTALQTIFSGLPKDFPAVILAVQHISQGYTEGLAKRLSSHSKLTVKPAKQGEFIYPGQVYLGQAGYHFKLAKDKKSGEIQIELSKRLEGQIICPSIDEIMTCTAQYYGQSSIGIILTGTGHDGREGMRAIHAVGGVTVVQDKASCESYDMPKSCLDAGIVDHQIALDQIALRLKDWVKE